MACEYCPLRTFQSAPLTLAATTSTTTSPAAATGSGKSPYFKTSGPPKCSMKAAFIICRSLGAARIRPLPSCRLRRWPRGSRRPHKRQPEHCRAGLACPRCCDDRCRRSFCMAGLPLPWSQVRVAELVQSRYRMGAQPRPNRRALIRVQPFGSALTTSRSTELHLGVRTPRNAQPANQGAILQPLSSLRPRFPIGADGDHWPRSAGRPCTGVDQDRTDSSASSRRHAATSRSGLNSGARRPTAR